MGKTYDEAQVISVRLDNVFLTGLEMIMEMKSEGEFFAPTRTDLVKEAISLLFSKYKVKKKDIDARIYETTQS